MNKHFSEGGGVALAVPVNEELQQMTGRRCVEMDYYAPDCREKGNKRCFSSSVRLSVCPSVAYIANNSRTQKPRVPKFGRKLLHLRCDSHTSFKVKTSKVRVTRPINADTHRAPYLPNGMAYELQTRYTDGGRRPALVAGAMTS